ncbi:MAG: hypothetical protein ACREH8_13935 [Opitutaceae bacterium]
MKSCFLANAAALALATAILTGCQRERATGWQGYLEGEFVYVASPLAGRLDQLATHKGARVAAGAPLFTLEHASELAAQQEAVNRLRSAQARLTDLKKGLRPSELTALEARIEQARAAAELSKRELDRLSDLFKSGAAPATQRPPTKVGGFG